MNPRACPRWRTGLLGPVWRCGRLSLRWRWRPFASVLGLLALALGLAVLTLGLGKTELGAARILALLAGADPDSLEARVVWAIRLPRIVAALGVAAALGVSGAVFQSVSRNPLGSPDIIGFTTGAATGAILQIVWVGQSAASVSLSAALGGLLTGALVYGLTLRGGASSSRRLILVGIGTGAMLAALNGLMLVKGNLDNAVVANLWLAGSLNGRTWSHAWPVLAGVMLLLPGLLVLASRLGLMEMGDDMAAQLGVRVERVRLLAMFLAVLLAALATGAAGPIAFVALAAPQLARRLGKAQGVPLAGAAAMGAFLLVLADFLTQWQPLGWNLPVGRLTGMLGGLYLIWLLMVRKKRI